MTSNIIKFNNLISPLKGKVTPLYTSDLPDVQSSTLNYVFYNYASKINNQLVTGALNPYHVSEDKIREKVTDVCYTSVKNKKIVPNINLDKDFPVGSSKILRLNLDKTNSIYCSDGSFDNNFISTYLKVLKYHWVKCTRLDNGKVLSRHLTHNPPDVNQFTFISNYDLDGKQKPQFISNISFEFDENMIKSMSEFLPSTKNINIFNSIISNNYETSVISEECLFHYTSIKKYDSTLYNEVRDEISSNIDLAMEILELTLNK